VAFAILLKTLFATPARPTRVDETARPCDIPLLELGNLRPYARYSTNYLVTWNHREDRIAPLSSGLVNIGMAHPTVQYFDQHITVTNLSAIELKGGEGGGGVESGIRFRG
jgi:hypothetical protein